MKHLQFFVAVTLLLPIHVLATSIEGQWKSSKELTSSFNNKHAALEPKQKAFLNQLMGHMTLTFSNGISTIEMPSIQVTVNGKKTDFVAISDTQKYKVIASNNDTAVIQTKDLNNRDMIASYHFENENVMWIYVPSHSSMFSNLHIREYFVRLK